MKMKRVRILATCLVVFLTSVNVAATQERPTPPRLPGGETSPNVMSWADAVFGDHPSGGEKPGGLWPAAKPPFSFVYDGKGSDAFLNTWRRKTECRQLTDRVEYLASWSDPKTGLKVIATAIAFTNFPAVDWVLRFENTGLQDSPIVEQVQALDIVLGTSVKPPLVLDQINGDDCSLQSFLPTERSLKPGESLALAPSGGRPSNHTFPFFNLQYGNEGFVTAVGWTGQWSAAFHRESGGATRLQAGMELTHLRLHPGEAIRTPRIMLLRWSGDRMNSHNTFRRLLLAHYLPKLNGQPVELAIAAQTFNPAPVPKVSGRARRGRSPLPRSITRSAATPFGLMPAGSRETSPTASATGSPRPRSFPTARAGG